jgi:hypothetical protein
MRARLLLVLMLTACAGPDRPVDLGFKQIPSDVLLGGATPTPSSAPPAVVVIAPPPSVISLPPAPFDPGPAIAPPTQAPLPSPTGCPTLDPLAAPRLEAPATPSGKPVPAAYLFANDGTFAVSGANPRKGRFPALTQRAFGHLTDQAPGTFTYDVAETIGAVTTTTTYRVVTEATLPGTTNGLYLVAMTYSQPGSTTATFTPNPSPLLAGFPLVRAATSDQRAVDPITQTTMTFTTTVEGKQRVPACGEPLDTWTVHLTNGTLLSPNANLQFDATYQLATQYGAIVVADSVAYTGTEGSDGVQRSNRARITVPPRTR